MKKIHDEGLDQPPFDSKVISPKTTRHSNTIDNVKAKIDNVKAKIQDKEDRRPWSRPTLARQVSASHGKSPPRTTSHVPTRGWARTCGARTTTDACGGTNLHAMQVQQLATMQATLPDKSLNAGLTGCAAITSPSSPTLQHASSARGTQAPSMTCTSLDLGLGVAS
jgi:hypothetical protein